jgi:hypothetical protein
LTVFRTSIGRETLSLDLCILRLGICPNDNSLRHQSHIDASSADWDEPAFAVRLLSVSLTFALDMSLATLKPTGRVRLSVHGFGSLTSSWARHLAPLLSSGTFSLRSVDNRESRRRALICSLSLPSRRAPLCASRQSSLSSYLSTLCVFA